MRNFIKFDNRHDAGIQLANELLEYKNDPDTIILAIPRGGVPVAFEVAKKLHLPLNVFIVRKLGVPYQKELAMGALASGDVIIFNNDLISELNISKKEIDTVIAEEKSELKRRESKYYRGHPFPNIRDKKIILIDDGIATGSSIQSAIFALKQLKPKKVIIGVPVAPYQAISELSSLVDKVYCIHPALVFYSVGAFYSDFSKTSDEEVIDCLDKIRNRS